MQQFLHGENLRHIHRREEVVIISDRDILQMWKRGMDTYAIAQKLFIHESEIANRLTHIRMRERADQ